MTKINNKKKSTSDVLVTQQDGEEEVDKQEDGVADTLAAEMYKTILTNLFIRFTQEDAVWRSTYMARSHPACLASFMLA